MRVITQSGVLYFLILFFDIFSFRYYRRRCLEEFGSDNDCTILRAEFDYFESFPDENPKNYQYWFHRRAVVEMIHNQTTTTETQNQEEKEDMIDGELSYTKSVFEVDGKNYHAWSHRQWILQYFGLMVEEEEGGRRSYFDLELDCINELLDLDLRNNSVWNHRWYIFSLRYDDILNQKEQQQGDGEDKRLEIISSEIEYVFDQIEKCPQNESPWNYLRGWFEIHLSSSSKNSSLVQDDVEGKGENDEVKTDMIEEENKTPSCLCVSMIVQKSEAILSSPDSSKCSFAKSLLGDIYSSSSSTSHFNLDRAIDLWDELVEEDNMRCKYWNILKERALLINT